MRPNRLLSVWLIFLLVFVSTPYVFGQAGAGGSIVGAVNDPSGAVVPGAEVTLKNNLTGTTVKTTTSSAGQYVFPVVQVGTYTLTVTKSGFEKTVIASIVVPLNQTLTQNVVLKLGAVTTAVSVTASPVHLDEHTSQATTTIDQSTYASLPIPLNGSARSPTIVADLMPGVADSPGASGGGPTSQAFAETINGGQSFGGEVMYDGAVLAQSNVAGDYRVQPVPVEALQEFALVQNSFSAEYGGTPGGILSFNSRTGTNQLHGEAYEYFQNDALDARGFFAATRPALHQSEFGANIGGPVIIPHLYNGKDKTFFFGYINGFRLSRGVQSSLATIPTVAEQQGDFSNYRDSNGNVIPIYDPATTQCSSQGICTRQQFPGNIIPPDRITGAAKAFLPYIPSPINANETNNALTYGTNFTNEWRYGFHVDHYISPRDVLHGFFADAPLTISYPSYVYKAPFASGGDTEPDRYTLVRLSEDHTFTPNMLGHITLGYNRDNFTFYVPGGAPSDPKVTLGIPNLLPNTTPQLSFSGYAGTASGGQTVIENGSVINGFLSWIKGKHQIKIGSDYERNGDNTLTYSQAFANFNYQETALPSAPNPAATGNGFASFLIGAVDTAGEDYYPAEVGTRFQHLGLYFEDDYKATSNLTLNLGVRYDIPWTRTQAHNVFSSFDANMPNPGAGGRLGALAFAGSGSSPYCNCTRFADTRYIYVQPRFGFAYAVNSKTVLRGGFGYFTGTSGDVLENGIRQQYSDGFNVEPTWGTANLGVTPAFYLQDGYPSFQLPPFISPTLDNNATIFWDRPQDGTTAFIANWSLDLQRELPGHFLLDVGYVANSAHHLGSNLVNPNQINPKYLSLGNALNAPLSSAAGQATGVPLPYAGFTGTVAQALRTYPQYLNVVSYQNTDGSSHYNSLQVKLQRRFFNGLSVLASYTYAKLMTNAEAQGSWAEPAGPQNVYNLAAEMSPATTLPPQTLALAYVYALPFGAGQRFLNKHGIGRAVLGGWSVSGIQHYQSGTPLIVTVPNTLPIGNSSLRPNIVLGQSLQASWPGAFDPATDVYLNAAAFSAPAPFTFGDAARSLPVRGFGYYDEDIGLAREFRIKESLGFQFRVDAFNIFNRTTFSNPDGSNPNVNPNFGRIGSQANYPRSVQFSARVTF